MATHAGGPGSLDVLEPWVAIDVGPPAMEKMINLGSNPSLRLWTINNASYLVDWERPTIQESAEGAKLPHDAYADYTDSKQKNNETGWYLPDIYNTILLTAQNIFHIPQSDTWIYFYINNYSEAPEPTQCTFTATISGSFLKAKAGRFQTTVRSRRRTHRGEMSLLFSITDIWSSLSGRTTQGIG